MLKFLAKTITKQVLLLGIVFYLFPIFWWTYNDMDRHTAGTDHPEDPDQEDSYFLSVRFLMSTGALLTAVGMGYVMLPIDLVPDWIPVFGGLDDALAKMTAGAGLMMAYLGHEFGAGDVPAEFEVVVSVVQRVYRVVVPFLTQTIVPLVIPALTALAVPAKALAQAVWGKLVQDGTARDTVVNHIVEQAKQAGASAASSGDL